MELGWIRENNCDVTEDDYLLMSLKKTCWYSFIHPCRIGALIAERDPGSLDQFNRFGYYVGTAFQIQDDVLNLVGDPRKYGKEIGGDLLEGKRTLILAHLFKNCSGHEKDRLRTFLSKPRPKRLASEVAWVQQLFDRYGSIEHARHVAHELLTGAQRELELAYGGASGNSDRLFLDRLVQYVVDREL
jgi:geranylgeranyl diphosphate synthase type II